MSATQERGKEMAMIAAIITHNLFEEIFAQHEVKGVMDCYDKIVAWADEFYSQYWNFDWDEMLHADGSEPEFKDAQIWDEMIIQFTQDKIKKLSL